MRKALKAMVAVAGRICVIGFSIQIVLGLLWMLCNFNGFQEFGDSYRYVKISKDFLCDEYTGILYPVLLLFARGVEKLCFVPCSCVMYLLQLLTALYAAHAFLQAVGITGRGKNLWGSLVLLTSPLAMQCHLAVLPESLVSSMLLLEIAWFWRTVRAGECPGSRQLAKIAVFWLAGALLEPEYLYLGALPVVLAFCYGAVRRRGRTALRLAHNLILLAAFAGILVGMNNLTQVPGACGRVRLSRSAALFSRFSWSTADKTYQDWPQDLRLVVDEGMIWETAFYPDNLFRIVGKAAEEAYGVERAEELFRETAALTFSWHRGRILHEIMWDLLGYGFAPAVSEALLDGRGYDSYTTRNYDVMLAHTPMLSKLYFHYGNWWFVPGLLLAGLQQLFLW